MASEMADRRIRIVTANPPLARGDERTLFSQFQNHANIVLLGDPGAGKSHLFTHFASLEGGIYRKVRSFLNLPSLSTDRPLFIDALDERRAGRGDQATINELVRHLFAVRPTKVRISCRKPDWLGDTDLVTLRDYFDAHGGYVVLDLDGLTPAERDAILLSENIDARADFLAEATARQLQYLLTNPQNLIMLCRVVNAGGWPATRAQLFERMTELLLTEHNQDKRHAGDGVYGPEELRDAAGAICAARLISDVDAVTRAEMSSHPVIPSYRSLDSEDLNKVQAALGRRLFETTTDGEAVDCVHRTVAEYVAAAWLAKKVGAGLPLGRLLALIGIDGHPAAELRGLHAWLALHLPDYATILIQADPYGVLTYGDAASLSPSHRRALLLALSELSRSDPGFRSGNWSLPALATLARDDMVEEFKRILHAPDANFALRSCVLEAIALGPPLLTLQPELLAVLRNAQVPYAERSEALDALAKFGPAGRAAVVDTYRHGLALDANSLRLRAEILAKLYHAHFGPADVVALLNDV